MKRFTALVLCIALLAALCGCTGSPAGTTTPPTTTEPAPLASDLYAEAAAKLDSMTDVQMEVTYIEEMSLGADDFKTTTRQTVTQLGIGTDAFAAYTEEEYNSGSCRVYTEETWLDGAAYSKMNYSCYKSELTAEEYRERLLPLALIDETLYETVEQTSDTEFHFTGAEILETWCDTPFTIADEVDATAKLDENGVPREFTYKASFQQGAADMNISVTVKLTTPELTEITLPSAADNYVLLDTPEGPGLLYMIAGYLDQATAVTSTTTDTTISQAAGFLETTVTSLWAHGEDATQIAKFDTTYQYTGSDGTENYTVTETYFDDILTTVTDGGEPEITEGLTGFDIQDAVDEEMVYVLPDPTAITDYDLTVMGDIALLEFTYSDSAAADYEDYLCEYYFNDAEILTNLSSASEVEEFGGSVGIDLATGMPLALNETFSMTHTIEGGKYLFSCDLRKSIQLGSKDAYEAITGEEIPAERPEEPATPVFYKVTGENGEVMWLLGTIHVGDERTAFLPQEIYDAFSASDALAVEFSSEDYTTSLMEDPAAIQAYIQALLYTDGTTLKDHIADETVYENTLKMLTATGNYTDESMVLLTKPVFHFQTLQNYFMLNGYRMSSDYGVDVQLEALAAQEGKEILSVESGEFQMDLLGSLSDPLQELMLKETIEAGQFAYNYSTQELFEMWCRGDEAELIEYLNSEEEDPDMTEEEKALYEEYETALGGDRNVDMLAVAEEYLNSGKTVFYAVGLAHLLAEDGLVNTLRNAGYTVELVPFA